MSYELVSSTDNFSSSHQTTDYTLSLSDCNGVVRLAGNVKCFIPASLPDGFNCLVISRFGVVTFVPWSTGVELVGQKLNLASPQVVSVLVLPERTDEPHVPREVVIAGNLS